jgi:hypothetical protein
MLIDYTYRGVTILMSSDLDDLIDRLLAAEAALAAPPVPEGDTLGAYRGYDVATMEYVFDGGRVRRDDVLALRRAAPAVGEGETA